MKDAKSRLLAEKKRLETAIKRREAASKRDRQRLFRIDDELHILGLTDLLNIPNAVRIAHRRNEGARGARLNDLSGMLTEIRRTRGTVVFSNGEPWDLPLDEIRSVDKPQGLMLW